MEAETHLELAALGSLRLTPDSPWAPHTHGSPTVSVTPDNPAGHMGDARCNGSAPANYSAVMSDTVRGDVHELTLRLSPGSPA
jgi:hypothetical protein